MNIIRHIAEKVRAKYPKGCNKGKCLDANNEIWEALYKRGYNVSIQFGWLNGNQHSWIEVWLKGATKALLIDVTADQFGDEYPSIVWSSPNEHPEYVYDQGAFNLNPVVSALSHNPPELSMEI